MAGDKDRCELVGGPWDGVTLPCSLDPRWGKVVVPYEKVKDFLAGKRVEDEYRHGDLEPLYEPRETEGVWRLHFVSPARRLR